MRNQSGEILRRVAEGETIQVTNRGQVAALIIPAAADAFSELLARGQVREARQPPSSLRSIARRQSALGVDAIVADVRGRW
jgi:prevent-host-death family protein